MVTTTSARSTEASRSGLGSSRDRSTPTSAMAATTAGLRASAGSDPAERTWTLPLAWWSSRAAAIWLRPALWTQTNRTSGGSFTAAPRCRRLRPGEHYIDSYQYIWHDDASTAVNARRRYAEDSGSLAMHADTATARRPARPAALRWGRLASPTTRPRRPCGCSGPWP